MSLFEQPERPDGGGTPPEANANRTPGRPREQQERAQSFLRQLDASPVAGDVRELLAAWLAQADTDSRSLQARSDRVAEYRQRGQAVPIRYLVEQGAELLLRQDANLQRQFDRGEIPMLSVLEGVFDRMFAEMLAVNEAPNRREPRQRIQRVLQQFRSEMDRWREGRAR